MASVLNSDHLGDLGWVNPSTKVVTVSLSKGTSFTTSQLASLAPAGSWPMDIDIY
ncbi:MAG: hypothetical protein U1F20_03220 [Lysobacterales bacterium]